MHLHDRNLNENNDKPYVIMKFLFIYQWGFDWVFLLLIVKLEEEAYREVNNELHNI